MLWPQSQDYNEAIQNAKSCFKDPDLKAGRAVINSLGVPLPCSGNFADVYAVEGANGKGKWAVKCFTRGEPAALRQRYAHIDKHLQQAKLPFTVGFQFLDEGMLIRGKWHPVLKMQWVEGFTLNQFVRDNLDKPGVLDALLKIWVRMGSRLREADLTHADLQHGNVLLVPGSSANALGVKLIDYDGMWVPSLAKQKSGEVGHPAYQHPQRLSEGIYSKEVDRFPLLVVATALRCSRVAGRALWDQFDNGDNLLFRESDLKSPYDSPLFDALSKLQDSQAKMLVERLRQACNQSLEDAPHLDDVLPDMAAKKSTAVTGGAIQPAAAVIGTQSSPTIAPPVTAPEDAFAGLGDAGLITPAKTSPYRRERNGAAAAPWRKWALIGSGIGAVLLTIVIIAASAGGGGEDKDRPKSTDGQAGVTDKKSDKPPIEITDKPKTDKPPDGPPKQPAQLTLDELRQVKLTAGESQQLSIVVKGADKDLRASLLRLPPGVEAKELGSDAVSGRVTWLLSAAADAQAVDTTVGVVATSGEAKTQGGFNLIVARPATVQNPPSGEPGKARQLAEFKSNNAIFGTTFSPDGSKIACQAGSQIIVLDPTVAATVRPIKRSGEVRGVCWLPDSRRLVVASYASGVEIMDESGQGKALAENHRTPISLAVSADGRRAAAICQDEMDDGSGKRNLTSALWIWDLESDKVLHRIKDVRAFQGQMSFSADGGTLLVIDSAVERRLLLLDVQAGKERRKLSQAQPQGLPGRAPLSRDGKLAALAYHDGKIILWDVQEDREVRTLDGHTTNIHDCMFSADGRFLVSCAGSVMSNPDGGAPITKDCTARLWDVASGKQLCLIEGHTSRVNGVGLSPDGRRAVTASSDKTGRVWDLRLDGAPVAVKPPETAPSKSELRRLTAPELLSSVTFSPDGQTGFGIGLKKLIAWDLKTGQVRQEWTSPEGNTFGALLPDLQNVLYVSGGGKWVRFWRVQRGGVETMGQHLTPVTSLAVSRNGKRAVSISGEPVREDGKIKVVDGDFVYRDCSLKIWDLENSKLLHEITDLPGPVRDLAISDDGKRAIGAPMMSRKPAVIVWDLDSGREYLRLDWGGRAMKLGPVAITGDGKRAAIALGDRSIRLCDLAEGREKEQKKLGPLPEGTESLTFSRDGRWLMSGGGMPRPGSREADHSYGRLWEVAEGREALRLEGHTGMVRSVALSPDGRQALTYAWDDTVRLWDTGVASRVVDNPSPMPGSLPGLRSFWSLDEGSGDAPIDSVTKKRGKINGSVSWVPGVRGKALQFDGNAHLDLGAGPEGSFDALAPFTIALWVRTKSEGPAVTIRNKDNGSPVIGLYVGGRLGGDSVRGDVRDDDNESGDHASLTGKTTVTDGEWHHVALVRRDKGNVRLFIDGQLERVVYKPQAKGKITTDLRALGADLYCIRKNVSQAKFYYQGAVDEFCIFDRELSVDEVKVLMGKRQPATTVVETPMPGTKPVSTAHAKAREDFAATIAKAQGSYNTLVAKLVDDQKTLLDKRLQDATRAGNTEAALAARDELQALNRDDRLLFTGSGGVPSSRVGKWIPGTWKIKYYPTDNSDTIQVRADGDVYAQSGQRTGHLKPQGSAYLLDPGDGAERFSFASGRLFIERAARVGDLDNDRLERIGVGELVKAAAPAKPGDFSAAMASAQVAYDTTLTRAIADYKARLQVLAQEETMASNLEGAAVLREEARTFEQTAPKPLNEATTPAPPLRMGPGQWSIRYVSFGSTTIVVQPNGEVFSSTGKTKLAVLTVQGNQATLEHRVQIERFSSAGGRLFVEYYRSKADVAKNIVERVGVVSKK